MKIAFCTQDLQRVDAHFGWAKNIAIYEVSPTSHQFVEAIPGQHEPARMLREMARGVDELAREFQREREASVAHIEVQFLGVLLLDALAAPAPDR